MSMIDDLALYTIWSRVGLPSEERMRAAVKAGIQQLVGTEPSPVAPGPWKEVHWVATLNFAHDLYHPGFYERLVGLAKDGSPLIKPLYNRKENFIHDLNGGGEFLAAKFDEYAVVIHTGPLATQWASGVSGKSGGGISAFWTPRCGTVLLGRCRPTQSEAPDEWTDENKRGPYTWAVHAITGRGTNGHYFSSARILDISSKYEIKGNKSAVVTIEGNLGSSATADPQDVLKGTNVYTRELRMDASGVAVKSGLTASSQDKLQELWEIIPVHFGPKDAAEIAFRVKGQWQPAAAALVEADRVRITRYGTPIYIVLDKARCMKVVGGFEPRAHGDLAMRNIMIDLQSPQPPSVAYKIVMK
jgi:hypothetical protein